MDKGEQVAIDFAGFLVEEVASEIASSLARGVEGHSVFEGDF